MTLTQTDTPIAKPDAGLIPNPDHKARGQMSAMDVGGSPQSTTQSSVAPQAVVSAAGTNTVLEP